MLFELVFIVICEVWNSYGITYIFSVYICVYITTTTSSK